MGSNEKLLDMVVQLEKRRMRNSTDVRKLIRTDSSNVVKSEIKSDTYRMVTVSDAKSGLLLTKIIYLYGKLHSITNIQYEGTTSDVAKWQYICIASSKLFIRQLSVDRKSNTVLEQTIRYDNSSLEEEIHNNAIVLADGKIYPHEI